MKEIPLSRGLVAMVDDEDFELVASYGKWYAHRDDTTFYARKNFNRGGVWSSVRMHGVITGLSYVDHINGNGLDNRRSNLRAATDSQNAMNRGMRSDNTSGFKGVTQKRSKWHASLQVNGKRRHLGDFATRIEAARAYDAAALIYFGEFARPNFPPLAGPIYQGV